MSLLTRRKRRYSIATNGLGRRREVRIPPGIEEGRRERQESDRGEEGILFCHKMY